MTTSHPVPEIWVSSAVIDEVIRAGEAPRGLSVTTTAASAQALCPGLLEPVRKTARRVTGRRVSKKIKVAKVARLDEIAASLDRSFTAPRILDESECAVLRRPPSKNSSCTNPVAQAKPPPPPKLPQPKGARCILVSVIFGWLCAGLAPFLLPARPGVALSVPSPAPMGPAGFVASCIG